MSAPGFELLTVHADNVDETGFFCYMSKRKSEGYRRKNEWLKSRFAEGLKILMVKGERAFIEYIPGEHAWRGVSADGYLFIHCLWTVGQSKKKGVASFLLQQCIDDARAQGKQGVAMVTSEKVWLLYSKFLKKRGFVSVASAPPSFDLMVLKFDEAAPDPSFAGGWDAKAGQFGDGFTVFRSDQCPYIDDAVKTVEEVGRDRGVPVRVVDISSRAELIDAMPSAFGVFSILFNGELLSYHYLTRKQLEERLDAM